MKITITCPGSANEVLAERARQVAEQHPARTPERRAAAACWSALCSSGTVEGARRALTGFGRPETQAAATALLGRLAAADCSIAFDAERRCYGCSHCGQSAPADADKLVESNHG